MFDGKQKQYLRALATLKFVPIRIRNLSVSHPKLMLLCLCDQLKSRFAE